MSISTTSNHLYRPIKKWQTRLFMLHAGSEDEPLHGDLLIGAMVRQLPGVAVSVHQDLVQYEAISYTWGAPVLSYPIYVNGEKTMVTASLGRALMTFRYADRVRYLWVDQICLNQNDTREKTVQVLNMFNIFNRAEQVIVWLGPAGKYTAEAIEYVLRKDAAPDMEAVTLGLSDLCCRPWGRRAWVQQEIFAAKVVTIHCGAQQMTLDEYKLAAIKLLERANDPDTRDLSDIPNMVQEAHCEAITQLEPSAKKHVSLLKAQRNLGGPVTCEQRSAKERCTQLECILAKFSHLKATDVRDRVYALLALSCCRTTRTASGRDWEDYEILEIDYGRSPSQVFQDVTKYIINRDRSLHFLFDSWGVVKDGPYSKYLPSWTPDWTNFTTHWTNPSYHRHSRRRTELGPQNPLSPQHARDTGFLRLLGIAVGLVCKELPVEDYEGVRLMIYIASTLDDLRKLCNSECTSFLTFAEDLWKSKGNAIFGTEDVMVYWELYQRRLEVRDFLVQVPGTAYPLFLRRRSMGGWTLVREWSKDCWAYSGPLAALAERYGEADFLSYQQEFLVY